MTSARMMQALSQFMNMLVSSKSRYDKGELTEQEKSGLATFRQKCGACHSGELFTDQSFRNNGIFHRGTDKGRAAVSQLVEDEFCFRVPSLRNVERTTPYMHDGRFTKLEDVVEHYRTGVQQHRTLDPLLKNGIPMNNTEKENIVAFLKSLTDEEFLKDKRFSEF